MAEDLEQLLAEGSEIAVIGYHVSDSYANIYSDARVQYYNMMVLPHVVVDGNQAFEWNYDDLLAKYEERIDVTSNYQISIEVEREGAAVNTTVNVGQIGAPNPETKVLHVVLTESHIPESWYGGDEVNHVERLMVPDANGTPIVSGESIMSSYDFEFEMDTEWLVQNCELVAFLQDTVSNEVMQANVFLMESTVLYNDVTINEIINPGNSYCLENISPIVQIENYGADMLESCLINYIVNGEEYEYTWEGSLSTYQSENVTLPEINFFLGDNNSILIELSQPNGQDDENPQNNSLESSFGLSQTITSQNLVLELKTDNFGSETSWELLNGSGEVEYSGNGYEDTTLYIIDIELTVEDCYTFNIYDTGEDGICCANGFGYYRIKDTDEIIYFVGGGFGVQDIVTFQIDIATDILSLDHKNGLNIFPNPVFDEVYIHSVEAIFQIMIMDTRGSLLIRETFNGIEEIRMDLDHLNTGIYIIQIETNTGWSSQKIIKY